MRVICITHATGERTKKELFSGLTDEGRTHVSRLAQSFRERPTNINDLKIQKILTSPHARCIETALLFARGVNGFTQGNPDGFPQVTPEIHTYDRLRENMITADVLKDIVEDVDTEAILLSVHNNLFKALPDSTREILKDWVDQEQFFIPRPVVVSLGYHQKAWQLLYCAAITPSNVEVRPK